MNSLLKRKSPARHAVAWWMGLALAGAAAFASAADGQVRSPLIYEDIDAFAAAIAEIDAGSAPLAAMERYMAGASPGMQIFTTRFGTSAGSIAEKLASHPNYYRYVSGLRPEIEAREAALQQAIATLQSDAPAGSKPVPIYFLVANMRAGGNPGLVQTPEGPRPVIGIAIELMAISERVDPSEFPKGPPGTRLTDLPTVALHEMSHIFQMQVQGMDNYRSLYSDPARSTNLAYAIREGCADFLVWRAAQWRYEDRYQFVLEHADQLWADFSAVLHQPVDPSASWFGPRNADHPERPMQVGYGVGMQICEAYYEAASDKSQALARIYGAYLPEHFEAILAPYATRMKRSGNETAAITAQPEDGPIGPRAAP